MSLARTFRLVTVGLVFTITAFVPGVSSAVDSYLKIPNCQGAEVKKGFEKQIRLVGFNSRLQTPSSATVGGGAGIAKPLLAPIEVLKDLDVCSPQFFLDAVTGKHIPEATITFVGAASPKAPTGAYFQVKLTDIVITGVEMMTVTGGQNTMQDTASVELNLADAANVTGVKEVVTFSFATITLTDLVSKRSATYDARSAKTQ